MNAIGPVGYISQRYSGTFFLPQGGVIVVITVITVLPLIIRPGVLERAAHDDTVPLM